MAYQTKKGGAKGVKIRQMPSFPKPRTYKGVGHGRSGPPMVDLGSKSASATSLKAAPNTKFAKTGSVSTKTGSTGPAHIPQIGKMTGHGSFATEGIHRSR